MIEILKFSADWCGSCKVYDKYFNEFKLEVESQPNIEVKELDTDKEFELVEKYKIKSLPTTVILKDGLIQSKHLGILSKNQLKSLVL